MSGRPVLVWSWRTLASFPSWPAAERLRALASGQGMAERAGYTPVFYGDEAALRELDGLRWPWETRPLPSAGADLVPEPFWSGTKLVALRDACGRVPPETPVIHCDHDGFVFGALRDLDAPIYAQNRAALAPSARWYPDIREAFGQGLPTWWDSWRKRGIVHECGLVGGTSRYAVEVYVDEALRCARVLLERGMLGRAHTWTLEQGVHAAVSDELGLRVGFALDENHAGKNYATWPSVSKADIPLAKLSRFVPSDLREALNKRFGSLAEIARPVHPFEARS